MASNFVIHIDRLKDGESLSLNETIPAVFMDLHEEEIQFNHPVELKGRAYLTDDHLIVQFDIKTYVTLPCAICNKMTEILIELKKSYITEPLSEIRTGTYDYSIPLREAILLETPTYTECKEGECPERAFVEKYLIKKESKSKTTQDVYFPFGDLDEQVIHKPQD